MATNTVFKWSDDLSKLLLEVTLEYKTNQISKGTDWESVVSKYSDITSLVDAEFEKNNTNDANKSEYV